MNAERYQARQGCRALRGWLGADSPEGWCLWQVLPPVRRGRRTLRIDGADSPESCFLADATAGQVMTSPDKAWCGLGADLESLQA